MLINNLKKQFKLCVHGFIKRQLTGHRIARKLEHLLESGERGGAFLIRVSLVLIYPIRKRDTVIPYSPPYLISDR